MLIVDFGSTETTSLTQYDRVIDVSQCTTVPSYDAMRSATDWNALKHCQRIECLRNALKKF